MSFIQSSIMDSKVLIANIIFFFFRLALGTPLLSSHRHIAVQPQACCPLAAITSLLLPAWRTVSE